MLRYKYSLHKKPAIDVDAMVAAMKEVMIDKKSQRSVAKAYNINDTKLHRYISELKRKNIDPATASDEKLADFVTTKSSVTGGKTVCYFISINLFLIFCSCFFLGGRFSALNKRKSW